MKRLLLIICIMFSITLNAQSDFYFGPKIGYKSNDITVPTFEHFSEEGNLTFGVFGRVLFNNNINIQSELMYNHSTITRMACAQPCTIIKVRNHSFALPVYFGYQFINRDNFNMRANLGPIVHFNFDKCVELMGREPDYDSNVDRSIMRQYDYNFANLGAAFNIGADIYRFTVDISYSLGLTNVFYSRAILMSRGANSQGHRGLNTFTFTVGYRFGK